VDPRIAQLASLDIHPLTMELHVSFAPLHALTVLLKVFAEIVSPIIVCLQHLPAFYVTTSRLAVLYVQLTMFALPVFQVIPRFKTIQTVPIILYVLSAQI
jgi:hypothetical protein